MTEKQKEKITDEITTILSYSDIVWSKYGSETVRELAERIAKKVELELNEKF